MKSTIYSKVESVDVVDVDNDHDDNNDNDDDGVDVDVDEQALKPGCTLQQEGRAR